MGTGAGWWRVLGVLRKHFCWMVPYIASSLSGSCAVHSQASFLEALPCQLNQLPRAPLLKITTLGISFHMCFCARGGCRFIQSIELVMGKVEM